MSLLLKPEVRDALLQHFYAAGRDHVLGHVKAGAAAVKTHALAGKLYLSKSGWLLLSVPNALIRGAFDALDEPGAELPFNSAGKLVGHISVMRPEDVERIGGPDVITERGHHFRYTLGPVKEVVPSGWGEMGRVWFIEIHSPELEQLRKSYGLSARPRDNKFQFHATIGLRRKHVLRENDVAKRRNLSAYADVSPQKAAGIMTVAELKAGAAEICRKEERKRGLKEGSLNSRALMAEHYVKQEEGFPGDFARGVRQLGEALDITDPASVDAFYKAYGELRKSAAFEDFFFCETCLRAYKKDPPANKCPRCSGDPVPFAALSAKNQKTVRDECCPRCGVRLEIDGGVCNGCGHKVVPEKKASAADDCPQCGRPYTGRCRCMIGDRFCDNGHHWHACPVHGTVVQGSGHGRGFGCTCGVQTKEAADLAAKSGLTLTRLMVKVASGGTLEVRPSPIDGLGLFAAAPFAEGAIVAHKAAVAGPGVDGLTAFEESDAARFVNHSDEPSTRLVKAGGHCDLVAVRDLLAGEELTVDYFQVGSCLGPGTYMTYKGADYEGESTSGNHLTDPHWIWKKAEGREGAAASKGISKEAGVSSQLSRLVERYGTETGSPVKRIAVNKGLLGEDSLLAAGFTPAGALGAVPEIGQSRWESFRHPRSGLHLHDHGSHWTIHEDANRAFPGVLAHAEKTPKGLLSAAGEGVRHAVMEGLPAVHALGERLLGGLGDGKSEGMLEAIRKEKPSAVFDPGVGHLFRRLNPFADQVTVSDLPGLLKKASPKWVKQLRGGLLSPDAARRVLASQPQGTTRLVRRLGHGAWNEAELVATNKTPAPGLLVRKLPRQAVGDLASHYRTQAAASDYVESRFPGVAAPTLAVDRTGLYQAFGDKPVVPGWKPSYSKLPGAGLPQPGERSPIPEVVREAARRTYRPLEAAGIGDIKPANLGPGGQLVDYTVNTPAGLTLGTNRQYPNVAVDRVLPGVAARLAKMPQYGPASEGTERAWDRAFSDAVRRYWLGKQSAAMPFDAPSIVSLPLRGGDQKVCPRCGKAIVHDLYTDKKGWTFHRGCFTKGRGPVKSADAGLPPSTPSVVIVNPIRADDSPGLGTRAADVVAGAGGLVAAGSGGLLAAARTAGRRLAEIDPYSRGLQKRVDAFTAATADGTAPPDLLTGYVRHGHGLMRRPAFRGGVKGYDVMKRLYGNPLFSRGVSLLTGRPAEWTMSPLPAEGRFGLETHYGEFAKSPLAAQAQLAREMYKTDPSAMYEARAAERFAPQYQEIDRQVAGRLRGLGVTRDVFWKDPRFAAQRADLQTRFDVLDAQKGRYLAGLRRGAARVAGVAGADAQALYQNVFAAGRKDQALRALMASHGVTSPADLVKLPQGQQLQLLSHFNRNTAAGRGMANLFARQWGRDISHYRDLGRAFVYPQRGFNAAKTWLQGVQRRAVPGLLGGAAVLGTGLALGAHNRRLDARRHAAAEQAASADLMARVRAAMTAA